MIRDTTESIVASNKQSNNKLKHKQNKKLNKPETRNNEITYTHYKELRNIK